MSDIVLTDFLIFGILSGFSSAIGAVLAKTFIEPRIEKHKESVDRLLDFPARRNNDVSENNG